MHSPRALPGSLRFLVFARGVVGGLVPRLPNVARRAETYGRAVPAWRLGVHPRQPG